MMPSYGIVKGKFYNIIQLIYAFLVMKYFNIFLLLINIFVSYMKIELLLFFQFFAQDALLLAIDFIKHNSDKNCTESQVLQKYNDMYKVGTFERYVYYFICQIIYSYLTFFILNTDVLVIKFLFLMTSIPIIFNDVIYKTFKTKFDKFVIEKNELIKKICFEQIANGIIKVEKTYLENDSVINKAEIIIALNNFDNIQSQIGAFSLNVLATFALIKARNYSRPLYKALKYAYKYFCNEYIREMTTDEAKQMFRNIVINKQYDQLTKPMFIQAMIYLYCSKDDTHYFKKMLNKINYRICVACTLWTFGMWFNGITSLIIILISSLLISISRKLPLSENVIIPYLSKHNIKTGKIIRYIESKITKLADNKYIDDRTLISFIMTILLSIYSCDSLFLSIINQFSGILLLNNVSFNITKIIYNKTNKKMIELYNVIKSTKYLSLKYLSIIGLFVLFTKISKNYAFIVPIVTHFYSYNNPSFRYIYPFLYVGMMNNKTNYLKIIIFAYLMSLINKFIDMYRTESHDDNKQDEKSQNNTIIPYQKSEQHDIIDDDDIMKLSNVKEDEVKIINHDESIDTDYLCPTIDMAIEKHHSLTK